MDIVSNYCLFQNISVFHVVCIYQLSSNTKFITGLHFNMILLDQTKISETDKYNKLGYKYGNKRTLDKQEDLLILYSKNSGSSWI